MLQQPADSAVMQMQEVQRLLAERVVRQREMDELDRQINIAAGLEEDIRPNRPTLSKKDFRNACRTGKNERVSTKKRQSMDCGLV